MPPDVPEDILGSYGEFLRTQTLGNRVGEALRLIESAWRKASVCVPGWPQAVPRAPRKNEPYTQPLSFYPETFQLDVQQFENWMTGRSRGPFAPGGNRRPKRAATIRQHVYCIRYTAWALVASGTDPSTIINLQSIVTPGTVEEIVNWYWARAEQEGGAPLSEPTAHIAAIARTLAIIAEHHVRLPPDELAEVRTMAGAVRRPRRGKPTRKVRDRVRQFDDPEKRSALLRLPRNLMDDALAELAAAADDRQRLAAARLARPSAMIAILTRIPLRIGNLHAIRIGTNLVFSGGSDDAVRLCFQEFETKNWIELEFLVGKRLKGLLRTYLETFLPILTINVPNWETDRWLFPSGGERSTPLTIGKTRLQGIRT